MQHKQRKIFTGVILLLSLFIFSQLTIASVASDIAALPAGYWYEIPNSSLNGSGVRDAGLAASYDPSGIMIDWSGGAFDTTGNRLLIWGGGHAGYGGNDVYAFSMNDFQWHKVGPSSDASIININLNTPYYSDGLPAARHTYNSLVYVPALNSFCAFGAFGGYFGSWGGSYVDCLNLTTNLWEQKTNVPVSGWASSTVDPSTGYVWLKENTGTEFFGRYNPSSNSWTQFAYPGSQMQWSANAAVVDPVNQRLVFWVPGSYRNIDIDPNHPMTYVSSATGDTAGASCFTGAYDSNAKKIVSWCGGTDVYMLDALTNVWTKVSVDPANTVTPSTYGMNGIYGRWQYVPSLNVFIVTNSVDTNTFVYRLTATGADTTPPTVFFSTSSTSTRKTFPITISGTDNSRVMGFLVNESGSVPSLSDSGWQLSPQTSYTITTNGSHTLYAWAKDFAGNISTPVSATVTVNTDVRLPVITGFSATPMASSLTVNIPAFTATDNIGVTGYLITETSGTPSASDSRWQSGSPAIYAATGGGSFILYAWVKDAEGNVSLASTQTITINLGNTASALLVGPHRTYHTFSEANAVAVDGSIIEADAGDYPNDFVNWTTNNLTIRGMGGRARIAATVEPPNGKGIWDVYATNMTIENIGFSDAHVGDLNGAGIRYEPFTGLMVVRNCLFSNNDDGIVTSNSGTGELFVEYSEFFYNGYGDGQSHGMYIGHIAKFTLQHSYAHHAKIGHNVKTRANENYILYNRVMDEASGTASAAVDIPNGGLSYVIGNELQQGLYTDNPYRIIDYGVEGNYSGFNASRDLYLINNTFVNDHNLATDVFVQKRGGGLFVSKNNVFYKQGNLYSEDQPTEEAGNIHTLTDPGFMDDKSYDYRLMSSATTLLNQGVNPGTVNGFNLAPAYEYVHPASKQTRTMIGAIDIGAYEYRDGQTAIHSTGTEASTKRIKTLTRCRHAHVFRPPGHP